MSSAQRIPVTVLTGFLGCGKTTLLNRVLREQHGMRIAVVENEFGEVGIDDALVIGSDEEIFEMNNGCICCTVRGDLIRILGALAKRRDRFDRVLIETTGLADPAPVAQTFFVDHEIAAHFELDAIVTLVDAKHAVQHLTEIKADGVENEAVEQVAFADRIVINKTDLVGQEQLAHLRSLLTSINPAAEVLHATFAEVPLERILDIRAFDLDRVLAGDPTFLQQSDHMHDLTVGSVGIECEGDLDGEKFNSWLGQLLATRGTDIFRSKGILSISGADRRWVFQGVHMLIDSSAGEPWGPGQVRTNRLVFIGRNLDREELEDGVQACLVGVGAPA